MKKLYFLLLALSLFTNLNAQIINFPDANLKSRLLAATTINGTATGADGSSYIVIDTNGNGEIEVAEALAVYHLNINGNDCCPLTRISI